jgi:hypothetical protein
VVLLIPATMVTFDSNELWQRAEWMDGEIPLSAPPEVPVVGAPT